jgi:hypothetical protein
VGIGTAVPTQKLEVTGNEKVNGSILTSITNGTTGVGGTIGLDNPAKTTAGTASSWRIYNMTGSYGNSLQFWAYDVLGCNGGLCASRFTLMDNGNVGIGTSNPGSYKLAVEGTIGARRIKVTQQTGWADFVFQAGYQLPSLNEVEKYIKANGHLQEIPSAAEVEKEGLDLGEMDKKLLQKIEELTLYLLQLNAKMEEKDKQINKLQEEIVQLKKDTTANY